MPPQKKPIQMQPASHARSIRRPIYTKSPSTFHRSIKLLHLEAGEGALLSLLVPLLGPNGRADGDGHLSHVLASLLVALGGLEAEEPFVVAIPAVIGLVLGGESSIAGRRADVLDNVQLGGILGRQLRHGFGKEFVNLGHIYNCALCLSANRTNPAQYETNTDATTVREKVWREVNTSVRCMFGISFNKHSSRKSVCRVATSNRCAAAKPSRLSPALFRFLQPNAPHFPQIYTSAQYVCVESPVSIPHSEQQPPPAAVLNSPQKEVRR